MNIVASLCKKGIDCTLHNISLFADFGCSSKCDFVAANCMDGDKLGFTKIYYCDVNESSLALVIFLVRKLKGKKKKLVLQVFLFKII